MAEISISADEIRISVAERAISADRTPISVADRAVSADEIPISVADRAISAGEIAISVAERPFSADGMPISVAEIGLQAAATDDGVPMKVPWLCISDVVITDEGLLLRYVRRFDGNIAAGVIVIGVAFA